MGIGREVADAYIDVHGDISSFRRDLGGADVRSAAFEAADNFSEAWAKRVQQDVNGKWGSILNAMYSDKQVDWDRMFGSFDARSLREARDEVKEFLNVMRQTEEWGEDEEGEPLFKGMKLELADAAKMLSRMDEVIAGMNKREAAANEELRKREDHQRTLIDLQQELTKMQDRQNRIMKVRREAEEEAYRENASRLRAQKKLLEDAAAAQKKMLDDAYRMNDVWGKTWDGMRKNNAIKSLEEDFKKLASAMNFNDLGKWTNKFGGDMQMARARIFEVTMAMEDQGRISRERALEMTRHFQAFMDDQEAQTKAMADALAETQKLKEAQDRYNESLAGMARKMHFDELEGRFRRLAYAVDSNDWSGLARGAKNMEEVRQRTLETANEMRRLGRMTDAEFTLISNKVKDASVNMASYNIEFKKANEAMASGGGNGIRFTRVLNGMGDAARGVGQRLAALGGLNVFGDLLQSGIEFTRNMDRMAVGLGKNTLLMGGMGAVGLSAFAGMVTVASDLGNIIGGLGVAAPAFIVGAGIGMGVLVAAMKDMKDVLADLGPRFGALQDSISANFWAEAEGPIRRTVNALLPILTPQLNGTARALGTLVGKLATAFGDIPADALNTMFDRMNKSVTILGDAMPPLVRAFTTLGITGSKYFERFSTWMVKLTNQFDAFIQGAAADGRLDKWINDAIEGFKDIGRAIDGAMGIFNAINTAAEKAGYGGLKTFADSLQRAADIMQSEAFQNTLVIYLEAARGVAQKLGQAIYDLGPAFERFAPTAAAALEDVGDAIQKIIGYIGDIFENPKFQEGVRNFTQSLSDAVTKLEPAVKPFAESLGTALTLMGKIVEAVAQIATEFTVTLGPVLDSIAGKFGTLVQPLADAATKFIQDMRAPLEAIDRDIVTPLVDAIQGKWIPLLTGPGGFTEEFGKFLTTVTNAVSPAWKTFVDDAMPNLIRLATEVLDPLGKFVAFLSPTLQMTVEGIARGLQGMADAVKVLKGELPIGETQLFKSWSQEEIEKQIAEDLKPKSWGEIFGTIMVRGLHTGMEFAWRDKVYPALEAAAKWFTDSVSASWESLVSGSWGTTGAGKVRWEEFWKEDARIGAEMDAALGKWWDTNVYQPLQTHLRPHLDEFGRKWEAFWSAPPGGFTDTINTSVNDFLRTEVLEPLGESWDKFVKQIPDSFKSDVAEWGIMPAIGNWFNNDIFPEIKKGFEQGYKDIAEGRFGFSVKDAKKYDQFKQDFNDFWNAPEGGFTDTINETVNKWFEDYVFKPLRDAWNTAWNSVTDWLNSGPVESEGSSGDHGQQFWDTFWGGFGGMMGDANKWAEDINTTVNNWLEDNVWKPVREWVDNLDWDQIGHDLLNGFVAGLTGKDLASWDKIGQGFSGWVEDMKNFFGIHSPSTLMQGFGEDIIQGLVNGFGNFIGKIGEKWEEIKTTVTTKFQELKDGLAQKWEEFKVGWEGFWGGLGSTIGTKWEEFKTTVGTKWEELRAGLAEKWEGFKAGWDTFWTDTGTKLGEKWEGFKTTVSTKWDELKTGVETKWGEFKTGWDTFWSDTGTTLGTHWENFKTTVGTKAGEIQSGIGTWATDVGNGWNGFWSDTGTNLKNAWEGFTGTVSEKAGDIKTNVSNFGSDVQRNWNGFWGDVGGTLNDKWREFSGTVQDKSNNMKGNVKGMGTDMASQTSSAMQSMSQYLTSSFQSFVNVVMSRVGDIVSWVSGMPGRISSALWGLGNLLFTHGSNIMTGFLNGLISMWGRVTSFVGGIASWIAANKGPLSYDRVLLEPAGEAIMLGLENGLRSRMDPLLNTLQAITAAVTDTVTADLSQSVMYVAGKDAAQGLADGLKANRSAVHTALGSLGAFSVPTSQITVGGTFAGPVGRPTDAAPGRSVTIAEGAIKIETPTKSPELVAAKVIDSFVHYSSL